MLGVSEDAEEAAEDQVWKRSLRFLRRELPPAEAACRGRVSNSGTSVAMSCPFEPSASRASFSRQRPISSSFLPRTGRIETTERPARASHKGYRACTVRTCLGKQAARRHEHLVQRRSRPMTCRVRNSPIPAPVPARRPRRSARRRRPGRRSLSRARKAFRGSAPIGRVVFAPGGKSRIRPPASHSARQRRRSRSRPAAV